MKEFQIGSSSLGNVVESIQCACAVAKRFDGGSHSLQERDVEIGKRCVLRAAKMSSRIERAVPSACEKYRQAVVVVPVAVGDAASVDDHAAVEQSSFALLDPLQLFEQIGELLDVAAVNLFELLLFFRVSSVVRKIVVAVGHADLAVAAVAAVVGEHEGGDSSQIGPEGQDAADRP